MRPWPALLFAALLLPAPAGGQPVTRRAFVDATHASGGAVLDLKPADFRVTEAGEVREVSSATLTRRPLRIVLLVDTSDAIRQPIGQIRTAIATFIEALDAGHEMMFVTSGTPQVRVQPTTDRAPMIKVARELFGTTGANTMYRTVDEMFHRFGQTTGHRPVFAVVTAEGFESTQNINPQEIKHISDHFISRGGTLHSIRLIVPLTGQTSRGGALTELPVTQMVARDSGGAYTDTSPNGLLDVLQRLAGVINDSHASAAMVYQVEYTGPPIKGRKPAVPDVRVDREGIQLKVFASP